MDDPIKPLRQKIKIMMAPVDLEGQLWLSPFLYIFLICFGIPYVIRQHIRERRHLLKDDEPRFV